MMLAQDWDPSMDPTGCWMSEKKDGVRAEWTGSKFLTRGGQVVRAPVWLMALRKDVRLDGEFWTGRDQFGGALSAVSRNSRFGAKNLTYQVFDSPSEGEVFEERLLRAVDAVREFYDNWNLDFPCPVQVVHQELCQSREHLDGFLADILEKGGEGVMLRKFHSLYEDRRSTKLLKVKPFKDAEAVVLGYNPSEKRAFKSMRCRLVADPSVEFDIGTGFNDRDLKHPPPVGSVVTFKYQFFFKESGAPRSPSFLRVRLQVA